MQDGNGDVLSVLLGADEHISVDRGLTEFRAGRPVVFSDGAEDWLAVPVEALDDRRLSAFRMLCAPGCLRLVVTARRARALGLSGAAAQALALPPEIDASDLLALATGLGARPPGTSQPASPAAAAAVDLAKLAHGVPAILAASLEGERLRSGAPAPALKVDAGAVRAYRKFLVESIAIASDARVPLAGNSRSRFVIFRDGAGNSMVAVVIGEPDLSRPVAVRLHSACLTGDVFGSRRCDCGDQLRLALDQLEAEGGVILYLPQEGRGLGIANKMRAYTLQDAGLDTIDANTHLGFEEDERDYAAGARMLSLLGIRRVWLMTNNPAKLAGLTEAGIEVVGRMPLEVPANEDNHRYLAAKAMRAGHQLEHFVAALADSDRAG